MHAADKRRRLSASHLLLVVLALVFGHAAPLQARQASPVYVDDSPSAAEGISRARELASVGNWDEAVRVLQALLDEQAEFVVPDRADEDLFVPTRSAVHTALWANTRLLERYAELEGPRADAMLRTGAAREVERTRLMTPAGFEATMQVAQHRLEDAAFAGAWLTLMQLDSHPQRTGERASAAAQLLEQVASYMAIRDETYAEQRWRIVDRWRTEANLQPLKDRRRPSAPDVRSGRTPFQVGPQVDLDGIVSKPLASRRMGEPIDGVRRLQNEETRRSIPELARVLHAVPMLADDVVYVNDSETISAWDRFTLTRKWRTSIIGTIEGGGGVTGRIGVEDVNSVVFADPYIVTLTGLSVRSQNARERALCALDPNTGVLIWRTSISEMGEPALDGADLRGPAIVDQDTVILAAIREVTRQRLLSVSLVGFDLATGQLKWHRSLGSIGFVPWALVPEAADAPLTSEGVTYRADRIGIIAAVESATGRLKWIRRMPRDFDHRAERPGPWGGNQPVRHGDHLFLLSPGRDRVLMLDAATGRIERQVNAGRFERPNYLLVAGGLLIGVGNDTITAVPLDALRDRRPQIIATFPGVGIRGRVLLAGDRLLVPTVEGVRVVAPELRPEDVPEVPEHPLITLDAPGNIVASQGQIIAVDDTRLHTYLSWEIAEALLRDRMDQDARRAAPAITYAELSFRAGRHERIVEAVDHALRAIERDPLAPESERDQHRLFDALLGMIEPAPDTPLGPDVSDDLRESLIDRMARVAIEPDQQVAYLMVSGDFYESIGQGPRAVERYQEVLASPVLAPIVFRSGATTLPAEAAATRRLRRLVRIDGPTVYAAYDAEARRALAQLGSSGSAADFERVARQYPVANSTPRAWVEAAERHSDDGRPQLAIFCLEEGLTAAGALTGTPEVEFGELAGRLLTVMLDNDRPVRARQRLARLEADAPELMLTVEGRPIDVESLRASIDDRLSQLRRRPRIGPEIDRVEPLVGWRIVEPLITEHDGKPTDLVVMENTDRGRALWRTDARGGLTEAWRTDVTGDLIRLDRTRVFFSGLDDNVAGNRSVTCCDARTGEILWITPAFGQLFADEQGETVVGGVQRVNTPLQPAAPTTDMFVQFDGSTMLLVERTGRQAAFDIETGRLLWAHALGPTTVHDAAARDDVLAVAGVRMAPPGPGGGGVLNLVSFFDLQTGQLIYEHFEEQKLRWIRMTPEGHAFGAVQNGVFSLDVFRRFVRWRSTEKELRDTYGAWVLPGTAIIKDFDNSLWVVDTIEGGSPERNLEVADRIGVGLSEPKLLPVGSGFAVASPRGVILFSATGSLLGMDTQAELGASLLPPAFGEDYVVTLSTNGVLGGIGGDAQSLFPLNIYDLISIKAVANPVMLEFPSRPRTITLLDGIILVTAGGDSAVIRAPVGDTP